LKYRPEIDGLRAISVFSVILFHLNLHWIQGGFLGVDVFFVISGFLITSIIIKSHNEKSFIINFWVRRLKRILPLLTVVVSVTLFVGHWLLYENEHQILGKQALAALFSVSNIILWLQTRDYWGPNANDSFFLHTWSLSVEEQFYIFFPLIAIIFLKRNFNNFKTLMLAFSVIGFLAFAYFAPNHPQATFYLMPSRFWELSVGCTLALFQPSINKIPESRNSIFSILAWISLCLILFPFFMVSEETGIDWYVVFPVLGAAIYIATTSRVLPWPFKVLSTKPFTFLGRISYSLYLWHWPVLLYYKTMDIQFNLFVALIIILCLAVLSYYLVEIPCRRNPRSLPLIIILFLFSFSFSYSFYKRNSEVDISIYEKVSWNGPYYDISEDGNELSKVESQKMEGIKIVNRNISGTFSIENGGLIMNYGDTHPSIIVIGDSHALMWSPILDLIAKELNVSISFCGMDGTSPYFYKDKITSLIQKWKPVVIVSSRWSYFLDEKMLGETVASLSSAGGKIILIEQPPELFFGDKNAPQTLSLMGVRPNGDEEHYIPVARSHDFIKDRDSLLKISSQYDCDLLKVSDLFLNQNLNMTKVLIGSKVLYIDEDHLSLDGALLAKNRIFSHLKKALMHK
jgi:peptidoglycan/LPS O-acetylase OafA/YrhL